MNDQLEGIVKDLFVAVDNLDIPALTALLSDDAQAVEEISKKWSRGKSEVEAAFASTVALVSNVRSKLSEFHTVVTGDTALVTCVLDQSYTYQASQVEILAPTTVGLTKTQGVWKISLIHSVPLA